MTAAAIWFYFHITFRIYILYFIDMTTFLSSLRFINRNLQKMHLQIFIFILAAQNENSSSDLREVLYTNRTLSKIFAEHIFKF